MGEETSRKKLLGFFIHQEDLRAGKKDFIILLAQGLGSGCIRPWSGTWGTLSGLLLFALVHGSAPWPLLLFSIIVACVVGVRLCTYAEIKLGQQDPSSIVWDEWCGIWLALIFLPPDWIFYFLGFVIFRFLDIRKPWPIGWADKKLEGGMGIMLDDILAGLLTAVIVWLLILGVLFLPEILTGNT